MIDQDTAQALLIYDPWTGALTWRARTGPGAAAWNTRWAGKEAGHVGKDGYRIVSILYENHPAANIAVLWMTGKYPEHEVDHTNLARCDNRWENLRPATRSQNLANSKPRSASGIKGVRCRKGRFTAQITIDKKSCYLGSFDTATEAHAAYRDAAIRAYGDFARFL